MVVRFFKEKIGVTPSVAAPGDTNPSDATDGKGLIKCYRTNFTVIGLRASPQKPPIKCSSVVGEA